MVNEIQEVARAVEATVVFIGSDNAGTTIVPVTSVGGTVAAETTYDVHVVRSTDPADVAGL